MPRLFYLIGHNPNSVEAATRCLEAGANAIEPDVSHESGSFYVHERIPLVPSWILRLFRKSLTLPEYLTGLATYLGQSGRASQLALIAFDLKPPYDYDVNELDALVQAGFGARFPKVPILFTVSDPENMAWLGNLTPGASPRAVGVDEHATPDEVDAFFRTRPLRYTYANGTSVPLLSTTCFLGPVRRATALRANGPGPGFRLVYAWTVNGAHSMRAFLDSDVDGIITDKIEKLLGLLQAQYGGRYVLATADDNPFQ
jgi:glycerophosphoryl diester phosphodiesterase